MTIPLLPKPLTILSEVRPRLLRDLFYSAFQTRGGTYDVMDLSPDTNNITIFTIDGDCEAVNTNDFFVLGDEETVRDLAGRLRVEIPNITVEDLKEAPELYRIYSTPDQV